MQNIRHSLSNVCHSLLTQVVAELAQARGAVKDVDAQIATVDEWLALQAAKNALDEEKSPQRAGGSGRVVFALFKRILLFFPVFKSVLVRSGEECFSLF